MYNTCHQAYISPIDALPSSMAVRFHVDWRSPRKYDTAHCSMFNMCQHIYPNTDANR